MEAAIVLIALGLAALMFVVGFFLGRETKGGGTAATTQEAKDHPGKAAVFASAGCGACHTLAAAGAKSAAGPSLDKTALTVAEVAQVVANGRRAMPPFAGRLSKDEIADVADFVATARSG